MNIARCYELPNTLPVPVSDYYLFCILNITLPLGRNKIIIFANKNDNLKNIDLNTN